MSNFLKRVRSPFSPASSDLNQPLIRARSIDHGAGNDALFLDAIYEHPDNKGLREQPRPFGTPRSALRKLGKIISRKLSRNDSSMNTSFQTTSFAAIHREPSGLFRLNTENNQSLIRDRKEMELHILLQSQFRYASGFGTDGGHQLDHGDSVSFLEAHGGVARTMPEQAPRPSRPRRAPTAAAPRVENTASFGSALVGTAAESVDGGPVNSTAESVDSAPLDGFMPSPDPAFRARFEEDQYGNRVHTFTHETIDMEAVDQMLLSTSHIVKGISSANGNCWLRAGWLAALTKHMGRSEGEELEALLRDKLGPGFYDDARKVREMAAAFKRDGIQEIVTGMELANRNADFEKESYLKVPGENNLPSGADSEGEAVCTRLTGALLRHAGVSEADIDRYIVQSNFGEHCHLNTLLRELDCDSIVFGRQVEWNDASATARFRPDWSVLAISARPGSRLENPRIHPGQSCTNALLNELDTPPIFLHKGAHFNLCIPKASLDCPGNFRWPT